LNKIFLYYQLVFLFGGLILSVSVAAQNESENDTIVIKPRGNYTSVNDTVKAVVTEKYNDVPKYKIVLGTNEVVYNDSLFPVYRPVPADTIRVINSDKGFYYKSYFDSLLRTTQKINDTQAIPQQGSSFFKSVFNIIIWVGAISLLSFLVFKLFLSNSALFSKSLKNKNEAIMKVNEDNPENPGALVEQAIRDGNYRIAVRYLYLQTLINLAEKNYIQAGSGKTNYQYVTELQNQAFVNEFSSLTLQYEYVWYGEYSLDNEIFERVHIGFKNFNKKLTN